jgi:hypothetical protein
MDGDHPDSGPEEVDRVTYCSVPASVYARLCDSPGNFLARIDDEAETVTFVDSTNGEEILRMAFGPREVFSEMVMVKQNVIEYYLQIDQEMVPDPDFLTTRQVPSQIAHIRDEVTGLLQAEDAVPFSSVTDRSPIASPSDVSESQLLKAKITATLNLARSFDSQENQLSALLELASFVLKETKHIMTLESVALALRATKRAGKLDWLFRDLQAFSLKL